MTRLPGRRGERFASRWPAVVAAVAVTAALSSAPFIVRGHVSNATLAAPGTTTATMTMATVTATSPTPVATRPVTPTFSPFAQPGVVPWAALSQGPETPPSILPTPTVDPAIPGCRPDQLAATFAEPQGGAGVMFGRIVITRISGRTCVVEDKVAGLTGRFDNGPRVALPIDTTQSVLYVDPRSPVERIELATPSDVAVVMTRWWPVCGDGLAQKRFAPAENVEVNLARIGSVAVADWHGVGVDYGCMPHTTPIDVAPVRSPALDPHEAHDPVSDLTVAIDAPSTVASGSVLSYTITLTNPTDAAIAFVTCPSFDQAVGHTWSVNQLNCAGAHPVPAHGSETFAMQLAVPASDPIGAVQLLWGGYKVSFSSLPTAQVDITVTQAP